MPSKKQKKPKSEVVIRFNSYQNDVFSAMFPAPFVYKGLTFKSIEHGYQYFKLAKSEKELRQKILNTYDPYKAKFHASEKGGGKPRKDHDVKRIDTMRRMIRESYMQNPARLVILMATGSARLSHLVQWKNNGGWGADETDKGDDLFGMLTTEFRDSMSGCLDIWGECQEHTMKRFAEIINGKKDG